MTLIQTRTSIPEALDRALAALEAAQGENHWAGELSSSALATAIAISALYLVDRRAYENGIAQGRAWLAKTQHADGGWGDAIVDPSNINATALATAALVLTSNGASDDVFTHRALRCLEQQFGGFEAVGDPERCTLSGPCRTLAAIAGLMDWREIKRLRPEVVLLPSRVRKTISTTFPAYLSIATLHASRAPHALNKLPTYRLAVNAALDWLAHAQGPNGSFEESTFLTSVIISCLVSAGFGNRAWLSEAVEFVVTSQRGDGGWPIDRDLEVFDTDLAVFAFTESGRRVPASESVLNWLLGRQFSTRCFATGAPPGGWPWAMPAGWPDSDDTAYTLLALQHLGLSTEGVAVRAGVEWLNWMQARDGSWSTFVRGSRMPFDHDCPYVTGHALSALQALGTYERNSRSFERALAYLRRAQRPDGTFASIWFRETTAGTASALQALSDMGLEDSSMARRARSALLANENEDGGWGGVRGQPTTAEETAFAVLALLAGDSQQADSVAAPGVQWLLDHQQADGTWSSWPIGLYYSAMWYSDSMYALALPAQALARATRRGMRLCVSA